MNFLAQHWPEILLATGIVIWGGLVAWACNGGVWCRNSRNGNGR